MNHHADPGSLAATASVLRRAADETEALAAALPNLTVPALSPPPSGPAASGIPVEAPHSPATTDTDQRHLLLLTARGLTELADAVSRYAYDVSALPVPHSDTPRGDDPGSAAREPYVAGLDNAGLENGAGLLPEAAGFGPETTGLYAVPDLPDPTGSADEPLVEQQRLAQALDLAAETLRSAMSDGR